MMGFVTMMFYDASSRFLLASPQLSQNFPAIPLLPQAQSHVTALRSPQFEQKFFVFPA